MSIHNSVRFNEQETRALRNLIEEGTHYFGVDNPSNEARVAKKLLAAVTVQSSAYMLTTLPDHGWKPLHWVNWGVCAIFLGLTAFLGLTGHPLWATVAAFFSSPPFVLIIRKPPAPRHNPGLLDMIRDLGWVVAVHNDYKLNGVPHTNANMDPEAARSSRLALYEWALLTIANAGLGGPRVTKKLAKLVIAARDIKFKW